VNHLPDPLDADFGIRLELEDPVELIRPVVLIPLHIGGEAPGEREDGDERLELEEIVDGGRSRKWPNSLHSKPDGESGEDGRRPTFVSVEANDESDIDVLAECGYEVGQIVNQAMNISVA